MHLFIAEFPTEEGTHLYDLRVGGETIKQEADHPQVPTVK